jgi:hypothetical protein
MPNLQNLILYKSPEQDGFEMGLTSSCSLLSNQKYPEVVVHYSTGISEAHPVCG